MKTEDVVHYLEGIVCLAEVDSSYIDEAVRMIKCGENYVDMWNDFKTTHGYKTTFNPNGDQQLCRLVNIMDKAETTFLGSKPETKAEEVERLLREIIGIIRESELSL